MFLIDTANIGDHVHLEHHRMKTDLAEIAARLEATRANAMRLGRSNDFVAKLDQALNRLDETQAVSEQLVGAAPREWQ
jgi:hypothetical protein